MHKTRGSTRTLRLFRLSNVISFGCASVFIVVKLALVLNQTSGGNVTELSILTVFGCCKRQTFLQIQTEVHYFVNSRRTVLRKMNSRHAAEKNKTKKNKTKNRPQDTNSQLATFN